MDRLTESQYWTFYRTWQGSLDWNPVEPGHRSGKGSRLPLTRQAYRQRAYLTSPEDDPVLVLRSVVLMILQLLPLDAYRHGAQLFIHAEVIGMF